MDADSFVERRIRGKAAKNGLLPDRCIDFRDLPAERRDAVLADLRLKGMPILLFWDDPALWTILTTHEVAGCIGTLKAVVSLDEIEKRIEIEAEPDASQEVVKLKSSILRVGPSQTRFWVPAGAALFGLWKTLLMFPLPRAQ